MTTVQGPQYHATIQVPPHRYPVQLQLRYKATSKDGPFHGFGQTRMISSKDIIFAPSNGLRKGMNAAIAVAWPVLLEGHVRLQLVLDTTITVSQDGVAEARILAYDFRTSRPLYAEHRAEAAGVS